MQFGIEIEIELTAFGCTIFLFYLIFFRKLSRGSHIKMVNGKGHPYVRMNLWFMLWVDCYGLIAFVNVLVEVEMRL